MATYHASATERSHRDAAKELATTPVLMPHSTVGAKELPMQYRTGNKHCGVQQKARNTYIDVAHADRINGGIEGLPAIDGNSDSEAQQTKNRLLEIVTRIFLTFDTKDRLHERPQHQADEAEGKEKPDYV